MYIAPKKQYSGYAIGVPQKYIIIGESTSAVMEPTETYFVK